MGKSLQYIIITIGALSLIAGIYMAYIGSEFAVYASSIFIGTVLIGSALINQKHD